MIIMIIIIIITYLIYVQANLPFDKPGYNKKPENKRQLEYEGGGGKMEPTR